MPTPTNDEIATMLVGIIADGFNRSLGALEEAGAIDCAKLRRHYTGVGSKYTGHQGVTGSSVPASS